MPESGSGRRPWLTLATTLSVQSLGSLSLAVPSVLAPAVAPTLGFGADRVGVFIGLAYLAAMLSGLVAGRAVARLGAVGASQMALLVFGAGMLATTGGVATVLLAAAVLVGTGYGVINPAAATLLNHHSPTARRGLFFSLKQAGVPVGVALAGLLLPLGLATIGWRASLTALGGVCLGLAVLLFVARRPLDPARSASAVAKGSAQAPQRDPSPALVRVLKDPALRRLSLSSFAFAFTQLVFLTFLVSYLNLQLGLSLTLAAAVLSASQVVSTGSRVFWGHAGDRWIDPGRLLGWLGIAAGGSLIVLAGLAWAGGPSGGQNGTTILTALSVMAAMVCATTAMGWNGVFFAELARRCAPAELATVAGATQFFTFGGSMAGPVVYGEILRLGGSYSTAYLALAALPIVAGAAMLRPTPGRAS